MDRALLDGPGWQRCGCEERVIQDVRLAVHNTRFRLEKWYSPSQHRTVVAPLPPGYRDGGYGPHVKALASNWDITAASPWTRSRRFCSSAAVTKKVQSTLVRQ